MTRIAKTLINYLAEKRKKLFLIDGLGAMFTAFFLFVIMRQFNSYFGMPETILICLSVVAICLSIYSTACFLLLKKRWVLFIRIMGIANLLYAASTTVLLIKYRPQLTIIAITYFTIEIAIVCGLAYIELNVANEIKRKNIKIPKTQHPQSRV